MADILLSVGVQTASADVSSFRKGIEEILSKVEQNPPKVKIGIDVSSESIKKIRSDITSIVNSIAMTNGTPITLTIGGIKDIQSDANATKKALESVGDAATKSANASKSAGNAAASASKQQEVAAKKAAAAEREKLMALSNYETIMKRMSALKTTAESIGGSRDDEYVRQINSSIGMLENLRTLYDSGKIDITTFKNQLVQTSTSLTKLTSDVNKYKSEVASANKTMSDQARYLNQATSLYDKMKKSLKDWTAASEGVSSDNYRQIQEDAERLADAIRKFNAGSIDAKQLKGVVDETSASFTKMSAGIKDAGENTEKFSDKFGRLSAKFSQWLTISQAVMFAVNTIKQMFRNIVELDTAMTELKKVTSETDAVYSNFLNNAVDRAKSVGATLADTVTATADFARLGYSISEASQIADAALVYKNVGDGIEDISEASNSIISTMQAFGIEASNVMSVVDKFNEVGNNFAISSTGIGEAMQRSAAALYSAGNTIDESIALITAANTIVQNPESVGTTMKTISMYLRAAKTEAEEAGVETDGMANSVSELRDEILKLTGNEVDIQIDENTFKSTYEIIKEISGVWSKLTDISKANILEMLGGKRNANVVSALIENFELAEDVLKTSQDAAGSALAENEKYLDSISGKIAQFQAQFQSLSSAIIDSELVKTVIDIGTGLLYGADAAVRFVNATVGLKTILVAVAGAFATMNASLIVEKWNSFSSKLVDIGNAAKALGQAFKSGFSEAYAGNANKLKGALSGVSGGIKAVTAGLNSMQIAFGAIAIGVTAFTMIGNAIQSYRDSLREANSEQITNASQSVAEAENIYKLYEAYQDAISASDGSAESKQAVETASANLASALDVERDAVDNLADSYKNLTAAELGKAIKDAEAAVIAAQKNISNLVDQAVSFDGKGQARDFIRNFAHGEKINIFSENSEESAKNILKLYDSMIDQRDELIDSGDVDNWYYNALTGAINLLTDDVKALNSAEEDLSDVQEQYNTVMGATESAVGSATSSIETYTSAVQTVKENMDSITAENNALNAALKEQGSTGNISYETYIKLIESSSAYADCVEYENGVIQINAAKANELFEAKNQLQIAEIELQKAMDEARWADNSREIERLKQNYDSLDDSQKSMLQSLIDENSAIAQNISGYTVMIGELESLTNAYTKWKNVQESSNSDTMYTDMSAAMKDIQDALESGKTGVGNVVYQAAVELLIPDGQEVSKYMDTLQRYITDGANGINNFISDMVTTGIAEQVGDRVELVAGTTLDQVTEKLTITPEMARAMFSALEMYEGWELDWTTLDFDVNTASLDQIESRIAEINAQLDSISSGTTIEVQSGTTVDELKSELAELESAKASLSGTSGSDGNTLDYTMNVSTDEAKAAIETLSTTLDSIAAKVLDIGAQSIGDLGASAASEVLSGVYSALSNINSYVISDKSYTVTEYRKTVYQNSFLGSLFGGSGSSSAVGTNNAKGGKTLVGELGPELVVSDGKYYTVGEKGAEFVNLKRGDIVFNHMQTEMIMSGKTGHRGAMVNSGSAMWSGSKVLLINDGGSKSSAAVAGVISGVASSLNSSFKGSISGGGPSSVGGGSSGGGSSSGGSSGGGSSGGGSSSGSGSSNEDKKSWFEEQYKYHNHLLEMNKEDYADYLKWLNDAYQKALAEGDIELEDSYKYAEEVYKGNQDLFMDSLGDTEHKISILEREEGNTGDIINLYQNMIAQINNEISKGFASGLDENDDYIQDLQDKLYGYKDAIKDIQDEIAENTQSVTEELIDYRVDMIKQELENEKDALNDRLSELKDFYDKQKEMLRDQYDEEKRLEERNEKVQTKADIEAELAKLQFDNSAWAEKRRRKLQEQLAAADKDLADFDKENALQDAEDLIDSMYEKQEEQIQGQIEAIDEKLNDPNALYNQALGDIKNNTQQLYEEMVAYNNKYGTGNYEDVKDMWDRSEEAFRKFLESFGYAYKDIILVPSTGSTGSGYASGTRSATAGMHRVNELGAEYLFKSSDGNSYRIFNGGGMEKVLNAKASNFLYDFANSGGGILSSIFAKVSDMYSLTKLSKGGREISLSTGDIIIQGNADTRTVSEIRREQRAGLEFVLKELRRLNV